MSSDWPSQAVLRKSRMVHAATMCAHSRQSARRKLENRLQAGFTRIFVGVRRAVWATAEARQRAAGCHSHSVINLLNLHEITGSGQGRKNWDESRSQVLVVPSRVQTTTSGDVRHRGAVTYVTARKRQLLNNPPHKTCFDTGGVAAHSRYYGAGEKQPMGGGHVSAPFQCLSFSFSSSVFKL